MTLIENFTCQECNMRVATVAEFHPHLYCTLFKAYKTDPEKILKSEGFVKFDELIKLHNAITKISQLIPPGMCDDDQNEAIFDALEVVAKQRA